MRAELLAIWDYGRRSMNRRTLRALGLLAAAFASGLASAPAARAEKLRIARSAMRNLFLSAAEMAQLEEEIRENRIEPVPFFALAS